MNISSRSINCTWYLLLLICVIFLFRYNRGEETYEDVQVHLGPFQTKAFRLKTHVWRCVRAFRPRLYALRFHQKMHRFKTLLKVDQNKNACISYKSKRPKTVERYALTLKRWPKCSTGVFFFWPAHRMQLISQRAIPLCFEHFRVDRDSWKHIKTVMWTRIDRCVLDDNDDTFENALELARPSICTFAWTIQK